MANPSNRETNYAIYGSLTPRVAEVLLDRKPDLVPANIFCHDLRSIGAAEMSQPEIDVMENGRRYVAHRNVNNRHGIAGSLVRVAASEVPFLQGFDDSDPTGKAYALREIDVTTESGYERTLMVARKRLGRLGLLHDGLNYPPYAPFHEDPAKGEEIALNVAHIVRNIVKQKLSQPGK